MLFQSRSSARNRPFPDVAALAKAYGRGDGGVKMAKVLAVNGGDGFHASDTTNGGARKFALYPRLFADPKPCQLRVRFILSKAVC